MSMPSVTVTRVFLPWLLAGSLAATTARADVSVDHARVISAEPVYRIVSVSVPTERCTLVDEPVPPPPAYRSYTGPILGAIVGGAIGNAVGHGKTNKKVGTAVGAVLGGSIGRDIQRRGEMHHSESRAVRWETREICETIYETQEREELDGFDVTYRYAGQIHRTRMDRDPGRYLKVRVEVTPA